MNDLEKLRATYGKEAPYSEHKRGDFVRYIDASGQEKSGVIEWVQSATPDIPLKYIIVPDTEGAFLDFVLPGDILTQVEQEQALVRCHWCGQMHLANQVEKCPLKPKE